MRGGSFKDISSFCKSPEYVRADGEVSISRCLVVEGEALKLVQGLAAGLQARLIAETIRPKWGQIKLAYKGTAPAKNGIEIRESFNRMALGGIIGPQEVLPCRGGAGIMVPQMDFKDLEQKLAEYAAEREVLALYLFGSAARNQRTPLSDIDIAVLLPDDIPKEEYFDLKLKMIAELTGLLREDDIDLVVLNEAPPLLKHRVVTYGQVIFCRDERARNRFEARAILEYLDFKPVLELQYRCLKRRLEEGRFGVRPRYRKVTARQA